MGLFSTWPSTKRKAAAQSMLLSPSLSHRWIDLSQGEIRASPQFIIIFYLSSLMQFLPGWVCCGKVEWNQAFQFAAKWDWGEEASKGEGKPSSLGGENVQRRVFIRCCPASQLGWLGQTVVLLYVTVYPVSLSHCLFYEHNLSPPLCYPICLRFQSTRVSPFHCTHLLASHQPTLQVSRRVTQWPGPSCASFFAWHFCPLISALPLPLPCCSSSMAHGLFNSKAEFLLSFSFSTFPSFWK